MPGGGPSLLPRAEGTLKGPKTLHRYEKLYDREREQHSRAAEPTRVDSCVRSK